MADLDQHHHRYYSNTLQCAKKNPDNQAMMYSKLQAIVLCVVRMIFVLLLQ